MVSVGVVDVDFRGQTTKFNQAVERGVGKLRGFRNSLSKANKSLGGFGGAALGAAGVGGLGALIKASLDSADTIAKASRAAGISTTAFQELSHATALAGVEQATLRSGLAAFNKRLGELQFGTGTLTTFLKKYDQGFADALLGTKNTEEALNLFLNRLGTVEDPAERAALASAAFGRTVGIEMTNLLADGAAGLEAARKEAHSLGKVLSEVALNDAEAANDAMAKLTSSLGKTSQAMILGLAPAIENGATKITEFFNILRDGEAVSGTIEMAMHIIEDSLVDLVLKGLNPFGTAWELVMGLVGDHVDEMVKTVSKKIEEFIGLFTGIKTKVSDALSETVNDVKEWMGSKLDSAMKPAKGIIESTGEWFRQLQDDVTGHSYIPDMVEDIGMWIDKLDPLMEKPVQQFTEATAGHFETLEQSSAKSFSEIVLNAGSATDALAQMAKQWVSGKIDASKYGQQIGSALGAFGDAAGAVGSFRQAQQSDNTADRALGYTAAGIQAYSAFKGLTTGTVTSGAGGGGAIYTGPTTLFGGSAPGGASFAGSTTGASVSSGAGSSAVLGGGQAAGTTATGATSAGAGSGSALSSAGPAAIAFAAVAAFQQQSARNRAKQQKELLRSISQDQLSGGFSGGPGEFLGVNETKKANGLLEGYIRIADRATTSTTELRTVFEAVGAQASTSIADGNGQITLLTGNVDAAANAFREFTPAVNDHFKESRKNIKENIQMTVGLRGNAESVKDAQMDLAESWRSSMALVNMDLEGLSSTASRVFTGSTEQTQAFIDIFGDGIVSASEAATVGVNNWGGGTVRKFLEANNASGEFTKSLDSVTRGMYSMQGDSEKALSSMSHKADVTGKDIDSFLTESTLNSANGFDDLQKQADQALQAISDKARVTAHEVQNVALGASGRDPDNLPRFATGGSFVIPGSGGTDSKIVPIRATPGERVTVETPEQQARTRIGADNVTAEKLDQLIAIMKDQRMEQAKLVNAIKTRR